MNIHPVRQRAVTLMLLPLVFLFCFPLASCTSSGKAINKLDLVIIAADAVINSLSGTQIAPAVAVRLTSILNDTLDLAPKVQAIATGSGTALDKSAAIANLISGVAAEFRDLPPGIPTQIVSLIHAVSEAVLQFQATQAAIPVTALRMIDRGGMAMSFAGKSKAPKAHKLSDKDRKHLEDISAKAAAAKAKLQNLKK